MKLSRPCRRRGALWGLAALCALAGCAGLRVPRIDPTGERILIWPKDQPQTQPQLSAWAPGNSTAPPVLTDPVFPAAPAVAATPGSTVATPSFATGGVVPASAVATIPPEKISITPGRILAPVGSEVVLKASICTDEGYTLADQKVEWILGRNGVGEFVEVGGKGLFHPPLISLLRGKKVDNYLARGFTANGPLCVNRGTADSSDDVNVNRGDAWVSVTAAHEGTSYVTVVAPGVESWNDRRGTAAIYWVDAQWLFPPGSVAGSGRPQTLTTTVTRQSDGTPVEGWIVRYEVADGGTLSGSSNGQVVEVRTGADGKATVEVAPTAAGAPSSRINMQLVRPAGFGGGESPRLVIASGTTLVNWSGSEQPYLPPSTSIPYESSPPPTTPVPPITTIPTTPTTPTTPSNIPPTNVPSIPARRPQLEVEVDGPDSATVGSDVRFTVKIVNRGDGPATGVTMRDTFQRGLSHLADQRGVGEIENKGIGTIEPGQTYTDYLTFTVNAAGELCHDVTVACNEGVAVTPQRGCVTATEPAAVRRPAVTVDKVGPEFAVVGEPADFIVTVKNTGETPLTNLEIRDEYPSSIFTFRNVDPSVQISGGVIRRTIDRLEVGQVARFDVTCVARQATQDVSLLATASAEAEGTPGRISSSDEHIMEVRPRRDAGGTPPIGGAAAGAVEVRTSFFSGPSIRAGSRTTYQVTLRNPTTQNDESVELRIQFPPEIVPDETQVQGPPNVNVRLANGLLEFSPAQYFRPNEELTYVVPVTASRTGVVEVVTQARTRNSPQPALKRDTLEIINP
jgi:uncharacterized repeat protein (TIGR01451 family)